MANRKRDVTVISAPYIIFTSDNQKATELLRLQLYNILIVDHYYFLLNKYI